MGFQSFLAGHFFGKRFAMSDCGVSTSVGQFQFELNVSLSATGTFPSDLYQQKAYIWEFPLFPPLRGRKRVPSLRGRSLARLCAAAACLVIARPQPVPSLRGAPATRQSRGRMDCRATLAMTVICVIARKKVPIVRSSGDGCQLRRNEPNRNTFTLGKVLSGRACLGWL
jgi:hypothetical protein